MRVFLYFLVLISIASCKNEKEDQKPLTNNDTKTTYYLIRHAEKDRSDSTKVNPDLTAKGFERARHWASYFDSIPLEKVYSTNYLRTSNTASYTAAAQKLMVDIYDTDTLISENFLKQNQGHNILIVGHSNTVPEIANKLLESNQYENMNDSDNSSLYVVSIQGTNKKSGIRKVELEQKEE